MGQEKKGSVNEAMVKAMGAFGGGIASSGRICGSLLGGVAFISSMYGKGNSEEKDDPNMWRLSHKLTRIFEEMTQPFGSMNCRDIAKVNWKDREAVREFYANPDGRRKVCIKLVGDLAYALGELVDQSEEKR